MTTYDLIRRAIVERLQVLATYHGHYREMCPHVLGTKNGKAHALFYQFGGTSGSGLPPAGEWRCVRIDDLRDAKVRVGMWHSAPHRQAQTCVDRIDVQVS